MNRTLKAATVYVIALFALGFVLGTIRVLFATPWMGELGATLMEVSLMEVSLMLAAAYVMCRWVIERWQVPPTLLARGAMALGFLVLLGLFGRWWALPLSGGRWLTRGRGWLHRPR